MADIGGSIEDNLAKKLKLNELSKEDQVKAVLSYFQGIMDGQVKTSPPELKGLLNLMYTKLKDDTAATITRYLLTHGTVIDNFFKKNMQKFDHFEFRPYLMKLKGENPGEAFKVPVNDPRNFERIKPLDLKPYVEILEGDALKLQARKEQAVKTDFDHYQQEKQQESQKIKERIVSLQQQIKENLAKGLLSKEKIVEDVKFASENCIPALQIKYNNQAIDDLTEIFVGEKREKDIEDIFASLKMAVKQKEKFCQILGKKVETHT